MLNSNVSNLTFGNGLGPRYNNVGVSDFDLWGVVMFLCCFCFLGRRRGMGCVSLFASRIFMSNKLKLRSGDILGATEFEPQMSSEFRGHFKMYLKCLKSILGRFKCFQNVFKICLKTLKRTFFK